MAETEQQDSKVKSLQRQVYGLSIELQIAQEREKKLLRLTDQLYKTASPALKQPTTGAQTEWDGITFVVVAYNIPRQLRRTLASCEPAYQGIDSDQLEVIVVDNGSDVPVAQDQLSDFPWVSQVIRVDDKPSPVHALNRGIEAARFSMIASMIDGAHILTPGICRLSRSLLAITPRPVINVPQYMLGDISQAIRPVAEDPFATEERLLAEMGWPDNGYALFDHCTIQGENLQRHALESGESNCLITTREVLDDCGGYDERFDEAGAGLANIEIFERLTHHPRNEFVVFPGEGSFHQDHHGTTTSLTPAERARRLAEYRKKYEQISGDKFFATMRNAFYFGHASYKLGNAPIISQEYAEARNQILEELSTLYFDRAKNRVSGPVPGLSFDAQPEPASAQAEYAAPAAINRASGSRLLARLARLLGIRS